MSGVTFRYNGREVSQDELDRLMPAKPNWLDGAPMAANTYSEHDPLLSDGCGVMRSQVGEARELIRKHGIQGAAVLDSGQVRFTSRRARKDFLKMRGLCDNDGCYGD